MPGALHAIATAVALRTVWREHPRASIMSQPATPLLVKRKLVEHEGTTYRSGNLKADDAGFSPDSHALLDTSPATRRLLDARIDYDNDRGQGPSEVAGIRARFASSCIAIIWYLV